MLAGIYKNYGHMIAKPAFQYCLCLFLSEVWHHTLFSKKLKLKIIPTATYAHLSVQYCQMHWPFEIFLDVWSEQFLLDGFQNRMPN
jgi:hypothetical protein